MKKTVLGTLFVSAVIGLGGCQSRSVNTYFAPASEITTFRNTSSNVVKTVENPKYWDKIELIRSGDSSIKAEKIHHRGRHRDKDIINCFGTDMPSSQFFCLHDAGKPENQKYDIPVLLVHGANTTATRSWADPDGDGSKTGLMQHLKKQGFRVFAVTFANKHGDNFIWSSHIHTAIERIRKLTGAKKVDTLGHSKGGFSLRLYVSNVNNTFQKDVNKAIFVGTPHRGIDYTFRHPVVNWGIYPDTDNPVTYAPLSWSKMLWKGTWRDVKEMSFQGEYFPGQAQMMAKLDKVHPLAKLEQDWYTTYYGGQGFVSYSPGIEAVIKQGGNLVEKVKKSPVDASVKVANLAGKSADVPGILNENTGSSDGIVFVKSAGVTSDLTAGKAKLLSEKIMSLNHLELVSHPDAMKWITDQLASN